MDPQYIVKFSFTTFDMAKSMMTHREGSINIQSEVPKEEIDTEDVKQLCVNEVLRLKPKWNILMLTVKSILPLDTKKSLREKYMHA